MRKSTEWTWTRIPRLIVLALLVSTDPSFALARAAPPRGEPSAEKEKLRFIICLRPAKPETEATDREKAAITKHYEYLKSLLAEGKLLLAGLTTDEYAGIVVIEVSNELEAERAMVMDPAVRAGVFLAELHPFKVALMAAPR